MPLLEESASSPSSAISPARSAVSSSSTESGVESPVPVSPPSRDNTIDQKRLKAKNAKKVKGLTNYISSSSSSSGGGGSDRKKSAQNSSNFLMLGDLTGIDASSCSSGSAGGSLGSRRTRKARRATGAWLEAPPIPERDLCPSDEGGNGRAGIVARARRILWSSGEDRPAGDAAKALSHRSSDSIRRRCHGHRNVDDDELSIGVLSSLLYETGDPKNASNPAPKARIRRTRTSKQKRETNNKDEAEHEDPCKSDGDDYVTFSISPCQLPARKGGASIASRHLSGSTRLTHEVLLMGPPTPAEPLEPPPLVWSHTQSSGQSSRGYEADSEHRQPVPDQHKKYEYPPTSGAMKHDSSFGQAALEAFESELHQVHQELQQHYDLPSIPRTSSIVRSPSTDESRSSLDSTSFADLNQTTTTSFSGFSQDVPSSGCACHPTDACLPSFSSTTEAFLYQRRAKKHGQRHHVSEDDDDDIRILPARSQSADASDGSSYVPSQAAPRIPCRPKYYCLKEDAETDRISCTQGVQRLFYLYTGGEDSRVVLGGCLPAFLSDALLGADVATTSGSPEVVATSEDPENPIPASPSARPPTSCLSQSNEDGELDVAFQLSKNQKRVRYKDLEDAKNRAAVGRLSCLIEVEEDEDEEAGCYSSFPRRSRNIIPTFQCPMDHEDYCHPFGACPATTESGGLNDGGRDEHKSEPSNSIDGTELEDDDDPRILTRVPTYSPTREAAAASTLSPCAILDQEENYCQAFSSVVVISPPTPAGPEAMPATDQGEGWTDLMRSVWHHVSPQEELETNWRTEKPARVPVDLDRGGLEVPSGQGPLNLLWMPGIATEDWKLPRSPPRRRKYRREFQF